jgi:AraC-like DNA-binding protein
MFALHLDTTDLIDTMHAFLYAMVYLYFFIPVFVILSPKLLYGLPYLETSHVSATQFEEETDDTSERVDTRANKQQLPTGYYNELATRILEYVESEKPYLDPDFQIKDICTHFVIPQHHVHYCLNEILHTDFHELKTEKRITHAKTIMKKIKNPVKPEDAGIASGFSTNKSFNIAFRKYTGMSPEQWLNSQTGIKD